MANYNINEINDIIQNNDYDLFIHTIPMILDEKIVNQLIKELCKCDKCSWLELAIPRFNIEIRKDIVQKMLSEIVTETITISNLRKISILLTKHSFKNEEEKLMLVDKMYSYFTEIRESLSTESNLVIPGDIVFYKIIAILRNLKETDPTRVRYILENICFIFSYQRELNFQTILKQMYKILKFKEYY